MHRIKKHPFIASICILFLAITGYGKVQPAHYGLDIMPDSRAISLLAIQSADSMLRSGPAIAHAKTVMDIEHERPPADRTTDFYLLLSLCLMLGLIRYSDPRYFNSLFRAFRNTTLSNRQLKEQLEGATLPNILMNVFFTIVSGAYIYYIVRYFTPQRREVIPPSLLILMLITGVMVIYLAKYAAVRFSGWAFRVQSITDHYLFNIFLINKIIGISLLPFIILLAFAGPAWTEPVAIVSFALTGVLLINRYTRSWQVFGSFFQYSKFHFFTYLCASELLPLAVLMKLLVRGLLYY
ncbi:MAG: hypothetical protein BGO69_03020 [Bacteroidetes bacterium 46-16]|nr:MAG: hypothetical protein BGO69_03020 [Bacteroidetes bacterium 46-16]